LTNGAFHAPEIIAHYNRTEGNAFAEVRMSGKIHF
jgi:hypothetical protein